MNKSRREFLAKLGATVGAITIGKNIILEYAKADETDSPQIQALGGKGGEQVSVDFRYAPEEWQNTFCFPDDPHKSLVGKNGDLRYGHEGIGRDEKIFPHVVLIGLEGEKPPVYVNQQLETPWIPIIMTTLDGGEAILRLTTFASKYKKEGRVDNLLVEIQTKDENKIECIPKIVIKSPDKFSVSSKRNYAIVYKGESTGEIFFIIDQPLTMTETEGEKVFTLPKMEVNPKKMKKYFIRFPQEKQDYEKLEDGLEEPEDIISDTRTFWQNLKPTGGKVEWGLIDTYDNFFKASIRNILQAREVKNNKKIFQVGPTVYRGLWIVDGHFLLEAARYLGYDKEAQEGLETIWDMQGEGGIFKAGAGEAHWKDTAVAV